MKRRELREKAREQDIEEELDEIERPSKEPFDPLLAERDDLEVNEDE